jgi:hypothetical protein
MPNALAQGNATVSFAPSARIVIATPQAMPPARKLGRDAVLRSKLRRLPQFPKITGHPSEIYGQGQASSGLLPFFFGNGLPPTLYSSITRYANPTNKDNGYDTLWSFPTLGRDPNQVTGRLNIAQTAEASPPANFRTLHVAFGETGKPCRVSHLTIAGNVRRINAATGALTDAAGPVLIIVFDGVDAKTRPSVGTWFTANPTSIGNMAEYTASTPQNPWPVAFFVPFTASDAPGVYTIPMASNGGEFLIRDPKGRFGILIGKIEAAATDPGLQDDGPMAQWIGWANAAVGPNTVWRANNATWTVTDTAPVTLAADAHFNQSARGNTPDNLYGATPAAPTHGTLNYFIQLNGTALNGGESRVGALFGSIRRRGLNVPTANVPESAPGQYEFYFYEAGTDNLKRITTVFSQPSYRADGTTTDLDNYFIEGIPVGNYDIRVLSRPIRSESGTESILGADAYPFSDFLETRVNNVLITEANPVFSNGVWTGVNRLNLRLQRAGDLAGSTEPGDSRDGLIDLFDLIAFFEAYGAQSGQPEYNALADLVGTDNPEGFPDGIIDLFDLVTFFTVYGQGSIEVP